MTDEDLVSAIDYREGRATGGDIYEEEQKKALSYYFGEKFGNEDPERSQIVMMDVYSVIEWIKPMLMKVFFGAKKVLKFTPQSGQDVPQAEQETDYVNHIVTSKNDGFLLFMTWFNDALLLKNGYVTAYWDERIDVTESIYNDVTEDILAIFMEDGDVEILEAEETGFDEEMGVALYKVRLREKSTKGQVKLKAIPPERVRVFSQHDSVSLKDCRYVRYRETLTISDLREQGFEIDDDISDDGADNDERNLGQIRSRASTQYDNSELDEDDPDPASREVNVDTCWVRIDFDGDGVAELRRVIKIGNEILYNEVDDVVGLISLTPTVVSHRHQGMSIADAVMDIQETKTMLVRGYIDNIFLANNGRYFVDDMRVNMDDFLVSRPGGVVRVQGGVSNAVQPFQHPVLGSTVIQAVEYLDNVLENRTGASPRVLQGQTFDGNSINKTATGINQIMSSVMARIELIARIFAETGVQDLYRLVHSLSLKHARDKEIFKLRGEFVQVDPRAWETRREMTIDVGLGIGDDAQQVQALQMLIQAQMNMLPMGLSTPAMLYNSMARLTEMMGFKDVESFWQKPQVDPQTGQPMQPQQPPNPEAQAAEMKAQIEQAKMQAQVQADQARLSMEAQARQQDAQIAMRKLDIEQQRAQFDNERATADSFIANQVKLAIAAMQVDADAQSKSEATQATAQTAAGNKRRKVAHKYDPSGRITESIVEE